MKSAIKRGIKLGIPIGLGYFAVAFSLGIVASNAHLTPLQGALASFTSIASAGEKAGFTAIIDNVPYVSMIIISIVANCRYILMSFALSQKINPKEKFIHRLLMGFLITDEFFGIAISQDGYCDPYITYGAALFAVPMWALGTYLGILMGNLLPLKVVSCLSIALYGMFIAIIVPPAKKSRNILLVIIFSFIASYLVNTFTTLSESTNIIILTIIISSLAALIFPIKEVTHD